MRIYDIINFRNSKSVKIRDFSRDKSAQKPKKDILGYMGKIQTSEESLDVSVGGRATVMKFDSGYLESFYPEEKLKKAKDDNLPGLMAFSRYFTYTGYSTQWYWKPCLVIDYDQNQKKFLLEWDESCTRKYATRLNILFEGESKELFFQRIETAVISRDSAEEAIKYYESIKNVKMPPFRPLCRKTKIAIISRIGIPITVEQVSVVVINFF